MLQLKATVFIWYIFNFERCFDNFYIFNKKNLTVFEI